MKNFLKKIKVFPLLVWLIVLVSSLSLIVLTYSQTLWRYKEFNTISYFNLSDNKVKFLNSDKEVELDTFDSAYIQSDSKITFSVNSDGSKLLDEKIEFSPNQSKLILYVNSISPYCFVSADVTSIYYNTGDGFDDVQNVGILSQTPVEKLETTLDWHNNEYVFPGRYNYKKVPRVIENRRLVGIYPIDCSHTQDNEKILSLAKFYANFNPEQERQYLREELSKYE